MIIGLEGVSCVGKSTLAAGLAAQLGDVLTVPCYHHVAPHPSWRPRLDAFTAPAQLANVRMLMRLEALRHRRAARAAAEGRHVVLDRTVDTILAHAHAVGRMAGFDCDAAARDLVLASPLTVPDVTLLLYASPADLAARAASRVDMPSMPYAAPFAAGFYDHFAARPLTGHCHWLDATVAAEQVAEHAATVIAARLPGVPA